MSKRRILIAVNERTNAEDIKRSLEGFGHSTYLSSATGKEILKKAQKEKPDMVLMDTALEGEMDGIAAAHQIHETLNIPTVFLATPAQESTLSKAKVTEPSACAVNKELGAAVATALSTYETGVRLQERGRFSSSLCDYAPNPIIVINPDTSVRYVNPALERLTGFSAQELIGVKAPYPWWLKESLKKSSRDLKKAMKKELQRVEELFQTKTGKQVWVESTYQAIKDNGQFKYCLANWVDITERKRAEEALQESEAQKKAILDASIDRIRLSDTEMRIVWANKTHTRDLDIPPESLMGKYCYQVFANRDRPCTECPVQKALKSGRPEHTVLVRHSQRSENNKKYLDAYAVPIKNGTGEVATALQITRDITAQVLAEEKLRESEANYRELADSITDVFFAMDKHLTYTYWNKESENLTGIAAKDAIGKSITFLFGDTPQTRKAIKAYRDVLRTQQPKNFITEYCLGGKRYFFDISAYPSRNGLSVFVKDITERKRTEEALRDSEEKYRLLVEHANDAIFISQDDVIKFLNPKTEEMVGYSAEELATLPFTELVHSADRDIVLGKYRSWLKGEALPGTYAFRIINRTGEELWVQLNPVLISWEGKPATLNFLRDITQQKKLESQLIQAQKMEAVGTLAGGIAHDFNNLLMGIMGFTSLMLMDLDPTHPHYERLQGIENQVQSGADLTKQLLGFAKGGKYEVKTVDVNELVKKTSSVFSRTKKEITVHRKYQRDIWTIEADPGQIEQVLLNLYVNAWQAMPGGGDLYLTVENFILDSNYIKPYQVDPGRYVKITVTDTGIGMNEATRQRIFEPFFTTKEMGRGTGLGLASVYGIVKNHSGYINVYSEEGKGTTFIIYLPASGKKVVDQRPETGEQPIHYGQGTVLLVDDEQMVLEVARDMLTSLGYTVRAAVNGKEALEAYEKERDTIKLVILDMIMPGMGGGELYDRLKQINPAAKVLLSSGYSIDGQAMEIIRRGCNGFIQKPFDLRQLSRMIKDVLDEK